VHKKKQHIIESQKIKNPETGRMINVDTALSYPKHSAVYKMAKKKLGTSVKSKADAIAPKGDVTTKKSKAKLKFKPKDNLYNQIHDKYANQTQHLKGKKIKKLTDLVSVQRWSLEDAHPTDGDNPVSPQEYKTLQDKIKKERILFKQYVGGNTKANLMQLEGVSESVIKEELEPKDYFELRELIRQEIASVFFDLYKKKSVWTK
jgi:hypothetical protein